MNELEKLEKELLQEIQEEPQIYADTEEFCTIDPETRIITVPPSKRTLGTESDQETNRLYFKCPKMVGDNVDLSLFSLRINYQNAGNKKDQYLVEDVKEEGDNITFSWLLKRNVTAYKGNVKFILCAVKTTEDGIIKNEWNTTLNTECESLEGMEVDKVAVEEETKDIVEQLIAMMNHSAENAVRAVEEAKAEVDKEVGDFVLKAQQALADVNNAGQAQTERVQTAGNDAVESVKAAQGTATRAVETAKTEAIEAVQTEGATQAGNVSAEGEKQVQAVRGAAQEIVADRGQIQENKTGIAKLKEDISNKITKFYATNQGETHITDSDNGKIQDMMIYGKSSQDGTPTPENPVEIKSVVNPTIKLLGSNILKINDGKYQNGGITATVSNGVVKLKGTAGNDELNIDLTMQNNFFFKEGTKIIFSPNKVKGMEEPNNGYLDFTNNNTIGFSSVNNNLNTPYIIKKRDSEHVFKLFLRGRSQGTTFDEIWKPQVLIGETITPLKPYTEQTIKLPITLNAIPVSSGGNVTIDGQQYVADYVDVERGKVVRKIDKLILTGEENWEMGFANWATYPYSFKVQNLKEYVLQGNTMNAKYQWYQKNANQDLNSVNAPYERCIAVSDARFSSVNEFTNELKKQNSNGTPLIIYYMTGTPQEENLSLEEIEFLKSLSTYYSVTNVTVDSEQLDGYTVFNYPISLANGWNYVKQQLNDNRDYIYDMDIQAAEAYVNSEYAVALTELEV